MRMDKRIAIETIHGLGNDQSVRTVIFVFFVSLLFSSALLISIKSVDCSTRISMQEN